MSSLRGARRFTRSCLPGVSQLDLHVDGAAFGTRRRRRLTKASE